MSEERIPSRPELYIRSIVFWVISFLWLIIIVTGTLLAFPFSVHVRYRVASGWAKGTIDLLRVICNVNYKVEGMDNLPEGAAIVMAKHQ